MSNKKYNKAGQPPIFKDPEELKRRLDKYFEELPDFCVKLGLKRAVPTIAGIARALGIDRKTLLNYSRKEEFFPAINEAKDKVAEYNEVMLTSGEANVAGLIFNLRANFGYEVEDKVNSKISGDGSAPLSVTVVDYSKVKDDE